MKKKIISLILGFFLVFNLSTSLLAQNTFGQAGGGTGSNSSNTDPTSGCGSNSINTAIGCINVLGSQEEFLGQLLGWAIGVGGGIAFLLIVYASFMIMSSSGNPERLKAGQELLTSAISGIILLVFSVFILRFIGIDILGLNSFGFGAN